MHSTLDSRRQTAPSGVVFFGTPQAADRLEEPLERFADDPRLDALLLALARGFGRRHWWPAASAFEIFVGAVLTQNTAWGNVEKALARLRAADALHPARLLALPLGLDAKGRDTEVPGARSLASLIRPSGAFRQKAKKLVAVGRWIESHAPDFDLGFLAHEPLEPLRDDLLAVFGIGPETADSILCYAAGRRTPVVDVYTRRVLERHGVLPGATRMSYAELRRWLRDRLLDEQLVFEEFHALMVAAGAQHCKPRARCEGCPAGHLMG